MEKQILLLVGTLAAILCAYHVGTFKRRLVNSPTQLATELLAEILIKGQWNAEDERGFVEGACPDHFEMCWADAGSSFTLARKSTAKWDGSNPACVYVDLDDLEQSTAYSRRDQAFLRNLIREIREWRRHVARNPLHHTGPRT